MFEHHKQPLLPKDKYIRRLLNSALVAFGLICLGLLLGVLGYHYLCHLRWIDSLVNASMILGGMGPVDPVTNTAGKLFASFYAIFSGAAFLTIIAVLLAPVFHRFLHRFHLGED